MSDLLSSSSLLLAIAGLFFTLWHPTILAAISVVVLVQRADREPQIDQVKSALWGHAVPLTVFAVLCSLVFFGSAFSIVRSALSPVDVARAYNPIAAALVLVELALLWLCYLTVRDLLKLAGKLKKLLAT